MPATRTDTLRSIRGIPDDVWRALRLEAVRQDRPLGDLLTDAIRDALETWRDSPFREQIGEQK